MTNATNAVPCLRATLPVLDAVIPLWPGVGAVASVGGAAGFVRGPPPPPWMTGMSDAVNRPPNARYLTRFSRDSSATGPITVSRQERQIVQS